MNESLLEALMQLFSVVAEIDGINDRSRDTVKAFLLEEVSDSQVDRYLEKYDQFIQVHHFRKSKKDGVVKQTARNSVKILRIATEINRNLTKQQKMFVVFRLVEYIYEQNILSQQNIEFLNSIVESFHVDVEEFEAIKIYFNTDTIPKNPINRMVIVSGDKTENKNCHFYEGVESILPFLWLEKSKILAFRKLTDQEIWLSGQQIKKQRTYFFRQGASLKGPDIQPIYYSDILGVFTRERIQGNMVFSATQIEYVFRNGMQGLHPMSFLAQSGEIVGIMGGSGTGKSTLLNVLNGNYRPSAGAIEVNGIDLYQHKGKLDGLIGYVPQDDLLIEELTVYQNLYYNARLSFGRLSSDEIHQKILLMLESLGLADAKDLKVGSPLDKTISGGQRKRLNISLELIREPSVLFVDEPTSGLSSRDSENIMDLLNELSLKGKIIFVVIHQPSSDIFRMFDKLLILDKGGYLAYQGNPVDAVSYFQRADGRETFSSTGGVSALNPEKIFDIIETKVVNEYGDLTSERRKGPEQWYALYKQKIESKLTFTQTTLSLPAIDYRLPNWWLQLYIFISRDLRAKLASTQYLIVNLLEAPVLAVLVAGFLRYYNDGEVYGNEYVFRNNDNILAFLFISVVIALFMGLSVSAEEIIKDLKIRKRESFLRLSKSGYIASKLFILFSLSAIQTFSFVWIANAILGIEGMNYQYWLVLWTAACYSNVLGLNISASFKNVVTIYILIPFIIIPQILFSGVLVKYENLNPWLTSQKYVPIIGDLMASRWAFEALAVNQAANNKYEKNYFETNRAVYHYNFMKNYWIPEMEASIGFISLALPNPEHAQKVINATKYMYREFSKLPPHELRHFKGNKKSLARGFLQVNSIGDIREFLVLLEGHYIRQLNKAVQRKDEITFRLKDKLGGEKQYKAFKLKYENERLISYLNNRNEINKIVEIGGELIRKENRMYERPRGYRTHYYAATKYFNGGYYSTLYHNVVVLWVASFFLILALYFNVLAAVLKLFSRISRRF